MRITEAELKNELRINDAISGDVITLYYRIPTTKERVQYSTSLFRRERNRIISAVSQTRQRLGREILLGFKDRDFGHLVDGKITPYASDPVSPLYLENWKDLVCSHASDLVEFLAMTVFEGNSRMIEPNEEELPQERPAGLMEDDEIASKKS